MTLPMVGIGQISRLIAPCLPIMLSEFTLFCKQEHVRPKIKGSPTLMAYGA